MNTYKFCWYFSSVQTISSVDNGYMSLGYAPQQIPDPSQGYAPPQVQVPNLGYAPQQVPDTLSGQIPGLVYPPASYYPTPSIWNSSDDFTNQNVHQFLPQQYYGRLIIKINYNDIIHCCKKLFKFPIKKEMKVEISVIMFCFSEVSAAMPLPSQVKHSS